MSIEIHHDSDMPECLNSWDKQSAHAKRVVGLLSDGQVVEQTRSPNPQGCFSRTAIVKLQNGQEVVVQFRLELMDMKPFQLAYRVLGDLVPHVALVQDTELAGYNVFVYCMNCIPGKTWEEAGMGRYPEIKPVVMQSLAMVLARCQINDSDSGSVVEDQLRPHLQKFLDSVDVIITRFKDAARDLMAKLNSLKPLPLFLSHADLNYMNIMVDNEFRVSGLVDWEFSTPLPFGMTFAHLSNLVGENIDAQFHITPDYEYVERVFWDKFLLESPENVRTLCKHQPELVQTAVTLGILLNAFLIIGDKLVFNKVTPNALPTLLTYRIPLVRAVEEPPFAI